MGKTKKQMVAEEAEEQPPAKKTRRDLEKKEQEKALECQIKGWGAKDHVSHMLEG